MVTIELSQIDSLMKADGGDTRLPKLKRSQNKSFGRFNHEQWLLPKPLLKLTGIQDFFPRLKAEKSNAIHLPTARKIVIRSNVCQSNFEGGKNKKRCHDVSSKIYNLDAVSS